MTSIERISLLSPGLQQRLREVFGENLESIEHTDSVGQLKMLADHIAGIPEQAKRAAKVLEIMGKSGAEFLIICNFPKADRDALIDGHLRTFGWEFLRDFARWLRSS